LNRYAYVVNNPLKYTDPTGEFLNIVVGAIAGAVIGGVTCATAHGWSWSNDCLTAIGAGAAAGAVAGALFNPALGFATYAGLTGAAATVAAGALAGAAGGAASYVTTGAITTVTGGQFEWSVQGFVENVLWGAAGGAIGAGLGYGIGRAASRLGAFRGLGSREIDDLARGLAPGQRLSEPLRLSQGAVLRRVFGGESQPFGRLWTTMRPSVRDLARQALELPPTNQASAGITAFFPQGTLVTVGRTSGGAVEVVVQRAIWRASFPLSWTW